MNDSPVGCQSHRTDRSIFSAEKMQDHWFKSFSRNKTNPQGRLPIAVFFGGGFSAIILSFSLLTHLTGITIPDTVTEIEEDAFGDCYRLSTLSIGSGVTKIGEYAFNNCYSLKTATIPNSVTEIGYHAFRDCVSLSKVTLSKQLKTLGGGA